MKYINNFPVWGDPLDDAVRQMEVAKEYEAKYCALMADHHLGYSVPVGGVIAYEGKICPNGVGFDIACGNKAVRLNCKSNKINMSLVIDEIATVISSGTGQSNKEDVDHDLFDDPTWDEIDFLGPLKDKARQQLGSIGSGNHYVDIFKDECDRVWVGVHFGSRGLGHSICTHFIKASGGKDGIHAVPIIFDESSDMGEQYIKCMELAGRYAYAGRDWVCSRVAGILESDIVEEVHNHHNFAWKESHFGKDLWVVRKGATPAFPGQKGFVGGSMGDISVILQGKESIESAASLYSTIHGAGRAMGRNQAKGKFNRKTGERLTDGLVIEKDHNKWLLDRGVEVRGGGLDESPYAYKRIENVLYAHKNTIDILHTLYPLGVYMAGD